jgi:hypothetical protein
MTNTHTLEDRGHQLATMASDLSTVDWAIAMALSKTTDKDARHALVAAMMTLNNVGKEMDVIAGAFGAAPSGAFDMQEEVELAAA